MHAMTNSAGICEFTQTHKQIKFAKSLNFIFFSSHLKSKTLHQASTSMAVLTALTLCVAFSEATNIVVYPLHYTDALPLARAWEHQHAVSAIAGLANRDTTALFSPYTPADDLWFNRSTVSGGWLSKTTSSHPGVLAV